MADLIRGVKVVLKKTSPYYGQDGQIPETGGTINGDNGHGKYHVVWEDGGYNLYDPNELELVPQPEVKPSKDGTKSSNLPKSKGTSSKDSKKAKPEQADKLGSSDNPETPEDSGENSETSENQTSEE